MEYNFTEIERRWQKRWAEMKTYKVAEDKNKEKFYVLNMFPYPSGAGLHVGHPLGYIASDIYARYKRLKGCNVLNPMGYDAYGLPAEQYAIQTGQQPAITTETNINRYREQLDKIGFSFDWDREVRTCDPEYYQWTQWAFQKMFGSFYCNTCQKAMPISRLVEHFEKQGTEGLDVACSEELSFTATEWKVMDEKRQQQVLMNYRIAYLGETMVNWCPKLGTVLANDEVVDGLSVRGGYPVVQKKMMQWCLRVSAYAQRLLDGLDTVDWTDSLKETQRNWIGRSEGTEMVFEVAPHQLPPVGGELEATPDGNNNINHNEANSPEPPTGGQGGFHGQGGSSFTIFTTRADTIFGVTFMVLAPESELVDKLTTKEQRKAVDEYLAYVKKRTERERISDHRVTGVFSGSYAINPFTKEEIPIWISEYVLAGYGTGAIMAVPAHDSRDYAFAKHFNLPIIPLIEGADVSEQSFDAKEGIVMNSPRTAQQQAPHQLPPVGGELEATLVDKDNINITNNNEDTRCPDPPSGGQGGFSFSLNGLTVKEAIAKTKEYVTAHGLGRVKVNYRLRDAIFSRQRYWGEPFPVYYKDGMPYMIPEECLPLELPEVDKFLPTETGEPPLGHATCWAWDTENNRVVENSLVDNVKVFPLELNTMPGFAGSSAYYLRYMDPRNHEALVSKEADSYWQNVDLYVGGTEHATGHLIYSRFWNKFLYDLGVSCKDEPFQKLVNQGMIQGRSNFVYRVEAGQPAKQQAPHQLPNEESEGTAPHQLPPVGGGSEATLVDKDNINITNNNEDTRCPDPPNGGQGGSDLGGSAHPLFVSYGLKDKYQVTPIHVDVNIVHGDVLDIEAFKAWRPEYKDAEFLLENGKYVCGWAIEKMSKSMFNVVNPDMIVEKYGADTLRLYEMFLGPVEQSKPWDTNGIDGCHRFLKKFWALFNFLENSEPSESSENSNKSTPEQLKSVHKLIKKVSQDIEQFSYNTSISAFMICVNELQQLKCTDRKLLADIVVLIAPFAPHIAEELWHRLGNEGSVCDATWPVYDEKYLVESTVQMGIAFNGKRRFEMQFAANADNATIEKAVMADERTPRYIDGKQVIKIIIVPKRMVNIVVK